MKITDIKIRKIFDENDTRLKAIISVTIDNCLAIHDIKVIESDDRLFIAMPSRKDENGIFRDIIHPIDAEARREIEDEILTEYKNYLEIRRFNDEFAGC